ncbi:Lysine ketoglutarate reductase trans-splicing-like protein, putative (DUF707) [Quillaja saponaria]|uniref:Lysine ketoglutarate reductase trans-splicing-like protein, putative (DUF707) n=1 Tax=Quillaja saponaria TaxID=32244 RepID=A0AAD7QCD0_QUISA|nr:Lysine ketoglutarate reductase trans-splicing-like protein, putative (DUF707) [Quillaja saponaria]
MKSFGPPFFLADSKSWRSCLCSIFPAATLLCVVIFVGTAYLAPDYKEKLLRWQVADSFENPKLKECKNQCRPYGSEALPQGIVSKTSNLERRPLWDAQKIRRAKKKMVYQTIDSKANSSTNLFAMAVGIKQKDLVNKMVTKFLASDFVVMLFHYDGIVDEWKTFEWSDHVIHVSSNDQTKWWFAKRFLHPDIVAEYGYIFLWDEDLGVDYFHPKQPALDGNKSEVHHQITARGRRSTVHRRIYKPGGDGKGCDASSTAPPCTGWIEMMAPVFSRAAWRCIWYMIQNDLIYAWGLDMQLGYCAQGDRTKNVGVVDAEYIVHYGKPTLGGLDVNEISSQSHAKDHRLDVRRQSYRELGVFKKRWKEAIDEDKCWIDPFQQPVQGFIQ